MNAPIEWEVTARTPDELASLEARLGYKFRDRQLLVTSLVHRSYANERPERVETNERLEFLGDAVLAFLIADKLCRIYPDMSEGELTRARASLVNRRSLAQMAHKFGLGETLILGRGARASGGHRLQSILSNAYEAILGAAYLDGGLEPCNSIVEKSFNLDRLDVEDWLSEKDYKTRLQEAIQSRLKITPVYVVAAGPPADGQFRVEVQVNAEVLGVGTGVSKAQAEQAAARMALSGLEAEAG